MLPIGNNKDGNFLFVKEGATEKDYREVKKMNSLKPSTESYIGSIQWGFFYEATYKSNFFGNLNLAGNKYHLFRG